MYDALKTIPIVLMLLKPCSHPKTVHAKDMMVALHESESDSHELSAIFITWEEKIR
jgi:hypothetical protein